MKYDVKIGNLQPIGNIKAYASVNLNDEFAITGLKVMEGTKGTFVTMPSRKTADGYRDICFPITKEARENLEKSVLTAYKMAIEQLQTQNVSEMSTETKQKDKQEINQENKTEQTIKMN